MVYGRYCSTCGQDNQDSGSVLDALGFEFLRGALSKDSKIWRTLFYLFFKPGGLTLAWAANRRQSFVHPRKLYLFCSILFFIGISLTDQVRFLDLLRFSSEMQAFASRDLVRTASQVVKVGKEIGGTFDTHGSPAHPDALEAQQALEKLSLAAKAEARLNHLKKMDRRTLRYRFGESFSHHLPKLIFLLVPVFAWIIALFFGSEEQRYVYHLAFAFHVHAYVFALAIVCMCYELATGDTDTASLAMLLVIPYLVWAAHKVYANSLVSGLIKLAGVTASYALALGLSAGVLAAVTLWWI